MKFLFEEILLLSPLLLVSVLFLKIFSLLLFLVLVILLLSLKGFGFEFPSSTVELASLELLLVLNVILLLFEVKMLVVLLFEVKIFEVGFESLFLLRKVNGDLFSSLFELLLFIFIFVFILVLFSSFIWLSFLLNAFLGDTVKLLELLLNKELLSFFFVFNLKGSFWSILLLSLPSFEFLLRLSFSDLSFLFEKEKLLLLFKNKLFDIFEMNGLLFSLLLFCDAKILNELFMSLVSLVLVLEGINGFSFFSLTLELTLFSEGFVVNEEEVKVNIFLFSLLFSLFKTENALLLLLLLSFKIDANGLLLMVFELVKFWEIKGFTELDIPWVLLLFIFIFLNGSLLAKLLFNGWVLAKKGL